MEEQRRQLDECHRKLSECRPKLDECRRKLDERDRQLDECRLHNMRVTAELDRLIEAQGSSAGSTQDTEVPAAAAGAVPGPAAGTPVPAGDEAGLIQGLEGRLG